MVGPDQQVVPNPVEQQRNQTIQSIQEIDRRHFDEWIEDPSHQRRLDLPQAALRHVLIAPRVFEVAEDPSSVGLFVAEQTSNVVDAYVVEYRNTPVTNPDSLKTYLAALAEWRKAIAAQQKSEGVRIVLYPKEGGSKIPPDVDPYHVKLIQLIEEGKIGLNDYVMNRVVLRNDRTPELLYVGDYDDREQLRGKGIASSFYSSLHELAKRMGFRFITGLNNAGNISYFRDKLQRSTLGDIKPELRTQFKDQVSDPDLQLYTIDFLNPQDKEVYTQK